MTRKCTCVLDEDTNSKRKKTRSRGNDNTLAFSTANGIPNLQWKSTPDLFHIPAPISESSYFFFGQNLIHISPPISIKNKGVPRISNRLILCYGTFPYLVFGTRLYFVFVTFPNFVLGTFLYQTFGIYYLYFYIFCKKKFSPVFCIQGFSEAVQLHLFLFTQCPLNIKVCQQLLKQSVLLVVSIILFSFVFICLSVSL